MTKPPMCAVRELIESPATRSYTCGCKQSPHR